MPEATGGRVQQRLIMVAVEEAPRVPQVLARSVVRVLEQHLKVVEEEEVREGQVPSPENSEVSQARKVVMVEVVRLGRAVVWVLSVFPGRRATLARVVGAAEVVVTPLQRVTWVEMALEQ